LCCNPPSRFGATNSYQKLIFVNAIAVIPIEHWASLDLLENLATKCVHLTSQDKEEIFTKYKEHLRSIISTGPMLKKAKERAQKLHENAERSFNCPEATVDATKILANATENLVNAKEVLYESKLKARAYDR
ncbi:3822_t:CDS:2, partial [Racocetra fulgida]